MRIVVTGGASGVGAALVERLRQAQHEIHVLDVAVPTDTDGIEFVSCDLSDQNAIDAAIEQLPTPIDALANVAGIARADSGTTVLAVNFFGLRHLTDRLFDRLSEQAAVVNVSSVAGRDWAPRYDKLKPVLETPSMAEGLSWCAEHQDWVDRDPYSLSKRLVTAYTLREAQRFMREDRTINCVSPGNIDTPLYPQFEALMGEEHSRWMIAQAGRTSTPGEIAEVIDMLLTSRCARLNGVDIPVDGGYTAGLESGWIDFAASPIGLAMAKKAGGG